MWVGLLMRGLPGYADADGHMGLSGGQGGDEFLAAVAGQQVITALRAAVEDRGDRLQVVGVPSAQR